MLWANDGREVELDPNSGALHLAVKSQLERPDGAIGIQKSAVASRRLRWPHHLPSLRKARARGAHAWGEPGGRVAADEEASKLVGAPDDQGKREREQE